jgi:hypothetical protein
LKTAKASGPDNIPAESKPRPNSKHTSQDLQ